jgi:hypothetical protein
LSARFLATGFFRGGSAAAAFLAGEVSFDAALSAIGVFDASMLAASAFAVPLFAEDDFWDVALVLVDLGLFVTGFDTTRLPPDDIGEYRTARCQSLGFLGSCSCAVQNRTLSGEFEQLHKVVFRALAVVRRPLYFRRKNDVRNGSFAAPGCCRHGDPEPARAAQCL